MHFSNIYFDIMVNYFYLYIFNIKWKTKNNYRIISENIFINLMTIVIEMIIIA